MAVEVTLFTVLVALSCTHDMGALIIRIEIIKAQRLKFTAFLKLRHPSAKMDYT